MSNELEIEIASLRRWKAEALPVIAGLQEVGHALGVPLGVQITGRIAVDAALDLRNSERERAQTAVVDVLEPLMDKAWESGSRQAWNALRDARSALLDVLATPSNTPVERGGDA